MIGHSLITATEYLHIVEICGSTNQPMVSADYFCSPCNRVRCAPGRVRRALGRSVLSRFVRSALAFPGDAPTRSGAPSLGSGRGSRARGCANGDGSASPAPDP